MRKIAVHVHELELKSNIDGIWVDIHVYVSRGSDFNGSMNCQKYRHAVITFGGSDIAF